MKRLVLLPIFALTLFVSACTSTDRFNAIASSCQTYAVALKTAAALNREGKLSAATQAKIDASIPPAKAVCTGPAPTNDPRAVEKISTAVIAVLNAQQEAK